MTTNLMPLFERAVSGVRNTCTKLKEYEGPGTLFHAGARQSQLLQAETTGRLMELLDLLRASVLTPVELSYVISTLRQLDYRHPAIRSTINALTERERASTTVAGHLDMEAAHSAPAA